MKVCCLFSKGLQLYPNISGKTLWELVQHINERVKYVKEFLHDICPELEMNVVPISDPYGPTQYDSTMDVIIVSAETLRGGIKVNEGTVTSTRVL